MLPNNLPLALVCALLLVLPGLLVGLAAGARGWLLIGSAPAFTLGFVALAGPAVTLLGIAWTPISAALALLVLVAVLAGVLRPWRPWPAFGGSGPARSDQPWLWWQHAAIALTILAAGLIGAIAVAQGTAELTGIHQYWDAMFHANAVRYVAETGDVDPASLGLLAQPGNPSGYYPDVYHALAALAYDLGVGNIPTTLDAVAAAFPVSFVLSLVAMTKVFVPRPAVVFAVALVGATFSAFPYDLINFGPLWPFALALVAAPAVIGLVARLLDRPSPTIVVLTAVTAAGLVSTHPAVAISVAIVAVFQLGLHVIEHRLRLPRAFWWPLAAAAGLALLLTAPVVRGVTAAAGISGGVDWPAWTGPGSALGVLITFNHENASPQWILSGLMFAGLFAARFMRRVWPLIAFAGLMAFLFVISSAYDTPLVQALTSFWWNDRWRFIALFVVPAALLAGIGLVALRDGLVRVAGRLLSGTSGTSLPKTANWPLVPAAALALATVVFLGLTGLGYRQDNADRVAIPYQDGPTVSGAERQAYRALAARYDGGLVMNDPADGSPWLYALEGVPLVFPAPLSAPFDAAAIGDRLELLADFDRYGSDDTVDDLVDELDIRWIVLGDGFAAPGFARSPGLDDLGDNSRLREVFNNGSAQVYEVLR